MTSKQRNNRLQRSLLATALVSCLAVTTADLHAQTANATLRGTVAGASAGTEVTATNVETGATRRTQTADNGNYSLVGLQPGTYTVRSGGSEQTVTLSVASTATLNLQANTGVAETPTQGPVTDIDTVVVSAPLLKDVKTSEVGNTVSLRQIQQLPQASRNFLEFADTVPGMAFTTDDQGVTSLRGGATNSASGNLYIDGVGQKGYVESGGVAGQNASRGNPFPQLAIGEYKVITSNYKAEYGQITGAAVTAATRSGTNEFEGELYYRYTDEKLREKRAAEEAPGAEKTDSLTREWGAAVGGPIIRDRMHFFVAYEKKDFINPRVVAPAANAGEFVQFLPPSEQAKFGPVVAPFEEDLYFGKISWEVTDRDRVELSAQVRDETQLDSVGGQRALEHGRDLINKDKRGTLRWEHSADTWFNELLLTTEDNEVNPFPTSIGNGIIYKVLERNAAGAVTGEPTVIETGPSSGFDAFIRSQEGWSIANNLTFTNLAWNGDHTVKIGASYKDIELTAQDGGSINPQFSYEVRPGGVAPTPYRVDYLGEFDVEGQRTRVVTQGKQYAFFIQDDWAVNDHLTLNLGLRWDYEENPAYTDYVTPAEFVTALYSDDPANPGQPWANRLLPSGIDAADYISTGNNRDDFKDAWAPRFGFSYDIGADERHVIHGGAGRSYDRNLFKELAFEVSKGVLSPLAVYFQDPATGQCYRNDRTCVPWDPNYLNDIGPLGTSVTGAKEIFMLNNDIQTPYSDQFSLGMSNQVGDWLTDITVQRILSYDGLIYTLINRYPDGSFFRNGSQPWGEPVPGFNNTIIGNNGIESQNTQVLVSLDKPYTKASGWSMSVAYTHTDAKHNRKKDDPFAFDKATIDQYPFIWVDGVPKHRLVLAGSIDGPWGLTFGGKIVLETPRPINEVRNYGNVAPDGSTAQPFGAEPPGTGSFLIGGDIWGYRTVDLQATKEFNLGDRVSMTARINVLNVFDYKNYSSFSVIEAGPDGADSGGVYDPTFEYNKFGDMYYVPRTLSVELGLKF
jgi:outer membrane receptor protein involved in Fe transport